MAKAIYQGVNGVARKVKKQYVGVDGVAHKIKKGYVGVDGVARQYFSSDEILNLGDIPTGTTIRILENGSYVDFKVAKHNYESGLNGNGRTALLRANYWKEKRTYMFDNFVDSQLCIWLNNTYKNYFSSAVKTAMSTTKYYYAVSTNTTVYTGQTSIFIPSATELKMSNGGKFLAFGSGFDLTTSNGLYPSGTNTEWSRSTDPVYHGYIVTPSRNTSTYNRMVYDGTNNFRPVFTLPSTTPVLFANEVYTLNI